MAAAERGKEMEGGWGRAVGQSDVVHPRTHRGLGGDELRRANRRQLQEAVARSILPLANVLCNSDGSSPHRSNPFGWNASCESARAPPPSRKGWTGPEANEGASARSATSLLFNTAESASLFFFFCSITRASWQAFIRSLANPTDYSSLFCQPAQMHGGGNWLAHVYSLLGWSGARHSVSRSALETMAVDAAWRLQETDFGEYRVHYTQLSVHICALVEQSSISALPHQQLLPMSGASRDDLHQYLFESIDCARSVSSPSLPLLRGSDSVMTNRGCFCGPPSHLQTSRRRGRIRDPGLRYPASSEHSSRDLAGPFCVPLQREGRVPGRMGESCFE
ncbi:hypothetical protein L249_1175 [Ophiocordyceps polyrhachis-furcata BCC 54312]|uniref:Uncharacterized protein n=1 Tax=Ophiocordyceps polyrhachis-furcata BCC 54312 TaxID=1330021 RepID=A0A367LFK5_9HYPO|nr:hypothetical protein L249_1175 [Ophiocordyceps polyrhachis-furcata BCC 54312]